MWPRVFDEGGAADVWDFTDADHTISGGDNDPYTDWIYWFRPATQTPGHAGYDASSIAGGALAGEVMARTILVAWNGGLVTDPTWPANAQQLRPANGTIFRIVSTKPNAATDAFAFTATANSVTTAKKDLKKGLKDIRVVPNPYYGRSTYQASLFDKQVKFINLPAACTIKIFTVAGDLVQTIKHTDLSNNNRVNYNPLDLFGTPSALNSSVEVWNLQNAGGKFVASGMYIALIDAPGAGKKMLKFAVIQEEITINGPDIR
jgi:hypothetical protein